MVEEIGRGEIIFKARASHRTSKDLFSWSVIYLICSFRVKRRGSSEARTEFAYEYIKWPSGVLLLIRPCTI